MVMCIGNWGWTGAPREGIGEGTGMQDGVAEIAPAAL